jgi:hypothetical protein
MSNEKCSIFPNITIYYVAVFIVVVSSVSLLIGIGSNQPQITMAQQQQLQTNQTFSPSVEEQQQLLEGISFQIDNVTFTHHMASVNGIRCTM